MGQDIMRFSIIIPSFLGEYRTAAKNREYKILRAINSVITQTYQDFEKIVIADGCEKTVEIMQGVKDSRVQTILIPKSKTWSGEPRNTGIENAKGEFILYLDIDDLYGERHLENIAKSLNGYDWVWFNDIRFEPRSKQWYENPCDIGRAGKHGTSNICHKRLLPYRWDHVGYAHDYYFVKHLRQNTNMTKIEGGEYYVCHVPRSSIGEGYDV
jgi:glycosyltransferase involved in cell wall biosynthesis